MFCFVLVALLGMRKTAAYDLGFHLKGGQWIAEHHQVPLTDTYTYSAQGKPYVDSHWLYQLALYGLYRTGSYESLTLAHVALLLCVFCLLALRCRVSHAPAWATPTLLAGAIFIMERRFMERPEILSWLLLGATLGVMENQGRLGKRTLWLLPLIQLLWVNIEGLFVLGWIVLGAYWADAWWERKKPDARLTLILALSIGADLINPNFIWGVAYPFSFISKLQGDIYNQTVMELLSIPGFLSNSGFARDSKGFIYVFFLYFLLVILSLALRKKKAPEILLAAAFFYLSFKAVRNIPLAMIVTLPTAVLGLRELHGRFGAWLAKAPSLAKVREGMPFSKAVGWGIPFLAALWIGLWGSRVATNAYYLSDVRPEQFGLGLDKGKLPVEASLYLTREGLDGKVLNSPNFGGWLEWTRNLPVYMDGRWEVMGDDLYRRYLDMTFSNGQAMGGVSAELFNTKAEIVVFDPRTESSWIAQLKNLPAWRLVYLDDCAAIYLTRGYRDDLPELDWDRMVSSCGLHPVTQRDLVEGMGGLGTSEFGYWLEGFYRPRTFPWGLLNRSLLAMEYQRRDAQMSLDLEMVRRTDGFYRPFSIC